MGEGWAPKTHRARFGDPSQTHYFAFGVPDTERSGEPGTAICPRRATRPIHGQISRGPQTHYFAFGGPSTTLGSAPKKIGLTGNSTNGPKYCKYSGLQTECTGSLFSSRHPPRSGCATRYDRCAARRLLLLRTAFATVFRPHPAEGCDHILRGGLRLSS